MADLIGVKAKLSRAEHHFETFKTTFQRFLEGQPYSVAHDVDDEGWCHLRWRVHQELPIDLPLIFGDALANLRASLDYLAWQLVLVAGNSPTDRTAFPCVRSSIHWASACGDRLAGINTRWQREIEKLQPYHRGQRPELHPFAILDHVNNINKHRALPVAVMNWQHWQSQVRGDIGGRTMHFQSFPHDPVEDGTEFFRVRFDPPVDFAMEMGGAQTFDIGFRDGLNHDWTMEWLILWVTKAVAIFEPAFRS